MLEVRVDSTELPSQRPRRSLRPSTSLVGGTTRRWIDICPSAVYEPRGGGALPRRSSRADQLVRHRFGSDRTLPYTASSVCVARLQSHRPSGGQPTTITKGGHFVRCETHEGSDRCRDGRDIALGRTPPRGHRGCPRCPPERTSRTDRQDPDVCRQVCACPFRRKAHDRHFVPSVGEAARLIANRLSSVKSPNSAMATLGDAPRAPAPPQGPAGGAPARDPAPASSDQVACLPSRRATLRPSGWLRWIRSTLHVDGRPGPLRHDARVAGLWVLPSADSP